MYGDNDAGEQIETFLDDANEACIDNITRQKTHYTNAL